MQKESALEAPGPSSARGPSGLRRLSLAMLETSKIAEDFKGATGGQGATRPGQVLAAFKAAAPHMGLSPRVVHAVDWLFTFTQPQDWLEGGNAIELWPRSAGQFWPTPVPQTTVALMDQGAFCGLESQSGFV